MGKVRIQNPFEPGKALGLDPYQLPIAFPEAFTTFAAGGWRSGKTVAGLVFCTQMVVANPGRSGAWTTGLVVFPTEKILFEFRDLLLKPALGSMISDEDRGQGVVYFRNGSRMVFLSGHIPERIEWYTAGWAYGDEIGLMKDTLLPRLTARLSDANCPVKKILFTGVPYTGWLKREFDGKDDSNRKIVHIRTTDNPHLEKDYVEKLRASCPKRMADCYINGQFVAEGDVVWPEFQRPIHVIPWSYSPQVRDRTGRMVAVEVGLSIDWSPRKPSVGFIAHVPPNVQLAPGLVTERETAVVVDQLYPPGQHSGGVTNAHLCALAKGRIAKATGKPYPLAWAVCDPAGKALQSTSGESDIIQAERNLKLPILFKHGQRVKVGVQHVKLALEPLVGKPFLYFSQDLIDRVEEPHERSVISAMENYAYPKEKNGRLDDEPEHDDVYSHAADWVRYHQTYFYASDEMESRIWRAG